MSTYQHLRSPKNSGTGLADRFLVAPVDAFTTISCPTPNLVTPVPGDKVTITVDHVFAATKGFIEILTSPNTNKFDGKTIGEIGSQKLDLTAEFFIPGSYDILHETVLNLQNTPCIVLAQDADCDAALWYQLGCDCLYAWLSFEWGTSDQKSGRKGYKVTVNYTNKSVLIYEGAITKQP